MSTKLETSAIDCSKFTSGTWNGYKCRDPEKKQDCCFQCSAGYEKDETCNWNNTGGPATSLNFCESGPCIILNNGSDSTCQEAAKAGWSEDNKYKCSNEECDNWKNINSLNGWCRTCEKDYVPNTLATMSDDDACTLRGGKGCPSPDECEGSETTCEKSENDKYICDMEDDSDAMKVDSRGAYCGCCPTAVSVADSFTDGQYLHISTKQDLEDIGLPDLRFGSTADVNFNEDDACSQINCPPVSKATSSGKACGEGDACYCWACEKDYYYKGLVGNWDSTACTITCPDGMGKGYKKNGDAFCYKCPEGYMYNPAAGSDGIEEDYACINGSDYLNPFCALTEHLCGTPLVGECRCEKAEIGPAMSIPGFKVVPTSVPAAIYKPTSIPAIQGPPDRVNAIEKGSKELCCKILTADSNCIGKPCEKPTEECGETPSQDCIDCQSYTVAKNDCDTYMKGYCEKNINKVPIPGNGIADNHNVWDSLDPANFPDGWTGNENYAFIENDNCKKWIKDSKDGSASTVRNYCTQKVDGNYPAIMRPLCVDYCKENPSDCKDALTDFCGRDGILKNIDENKRIDDLDYIDGQNSGRSVNEAPDICGCYLPQDIYDNFYKDLDETAYITSSGKEAAKHIANFNNYSCSFNACRNSLIHPDPNFPSGCPDTSICWNELHIDAKGSIIGEVNIEGGCTGDCDKTVCVNPKYYKCSEDKNGLSCQSQPLGATPTNYGDPTCGGECAPSTAKYLCKGDIIKKTCELQSSGIGMDLDVCNYDCAQENNKNKKIVNIWIIIGSSILVLIISSVIYLVIRRRRLNKGE